jgi:predicted Zn-dependent peptidase
LKFHKHTLDNGLVVVAEVNPEAHSASMGFFVQAGSRDESDAVSGVSHFLEHMAFKGSDRLTGDDLNRAFDEIGASYNAYTSEEHTVYYASTLPEYQGRVVELLGDLLRPALRLDDFTTEKQVIIEEIRMYEDSPPFGADDKLKAAYFGGHPLGRSVLGTVDSIAQLPVEAMRDYFEQRYSPSNIALIAAGKIDFEQFVRDAEKACGHWPTAKVERQLSTPVGLAGRQCLHKPSATMEYVLRLGAGPTATDDRRFAAKVLATVLGDDSGSRLYWELVDNGLAEQVSLHHYEYQGAGLFMTYMTSEPEAAGENLQTIRRIFAEAEASGVTAEELAQAKSKINSRVVLGSERPRGRLFNVGSNWLQRGTYRAVDEDLRALDAVTLEDVRRVLVDFPLSQAMEMAVGPLAEFEA